MYKHLLIPTDGSKVADKAVSAGIEFAREAGARVTLFTAVPEYRSPSEGEVMARRPGISIEEHERRAQKKAHGVQKLVPGHELVVHRRAREVAVVAAQAHQLVGVLHRVGRERDLDHLAAEEERRGLLLLGREHLEPPHLLRERRDRDQPARLDEVHRLERQRAHELGLLARRDEVLLPALERGLPVVAAAELGRGLRHLGLAPRELADDSP